MAIESPTYSPAEQAALQGLEGQDLARRQIELANEQADTIGDIRHGIDQALQAAEDAGDEQATEALKQHDQTVDGITEGYDDVQIEDFADGQLGENRVGTHDSKVERNLFSLDAIKDDANQAEEVILHEDGDASGSVGHANQRTDLQALAVDTDDGIVVGSELLEGENEAGLSKKLRGSVHKAREGQPTELYGSGQEKVAPHFEAISDYVRDGADRVMTQVEIFRQSATSRERMMELMANAGYSDDEMQQVQDQVRAAA